MGATRLPCPLNFFRLTRSSFGYGLIGGGEATIIPCIVLNQKCFNDNIQYNIDIIPNAISHPLQPYVASFLTIYSSPTLAYSISRGIYKHRSFGSPGF